MPIQITKQEVLNYQTSTWKTYASQERVERQINLLGQYRVVVNGETYLNRASYEDAIKCFVEELSKKVPFYKQAVEFV